MANPVKQPTLFEVFGRSQSPVVPEINEGSLNRVVDIVKASGEEMGKIVLLRSPRAGYGKTLLLHSMSNRLSEGFRFLAVEPSGGGRIDGEVVLESVVRQLSEVLPASGGLTEFDLFARRLLALGLKPLLISGEIPSHDREGALFAIENRPIETFDFHHQQAATAHWTQANFEVLGPRLASELSELSRSSLRGCAYWIDLLFRYSTTPPEKVERTRLLSDAIFGDLQSQPGSSGSEDRLQSLLALMGLVEPVVLVFDETEGLSNQPEAGLRVAAFVVQLRQACPALTVVLAVNEDVWETGLTPLLPGGLADRLTEYEVRLSSLSRKDADTLLESRFGDDASGISEKMKWTEPLSARGVLRDATLTVRKIEAGEDFEEEVPKASLEAKPKKETTTSSLTDLAATATAVTGATATVAVSNEETFEEKAKRILEPISSPEAPASKVAEPPSGTASDTAPKSEPEAKPVEPTKDPFSNPIGDAVEASPKSETNKIVDVEVVPPALEASPPIEASVKAELESTASIESAPKAESSSPFAMVSDPAVTEESVVEEKTPSNEPHETVTSSPFAAVEVSSPSPEPAQATAGNWSAQSAVEHFAASQKESPGSSLIAEELTQEEAPVGSAFDAPVTTKPAVASQPEPVISEPNPQAEAAPSPFQIHQEEKTQEAEAAAPKVKEAATAQASPFSVSESIATPPTAQPAPSAAPVSAITPSVNANLTPADTIAERSPFEINQDSTPIPAAAAQTTTQTGPAAPVQSVRTVTAPVTEKAAPNEQPIPQPAQTAPRQEVLAEESPFTTATSTPTTPANSPFSVSPQPSVDASNSQDTEDVEALLNQFKKRFGQSNNLAE